MAKSISNDVLDAAIDEFATAVRVVVCSAEPANFAGIAAVALADVTVTAGIGNGDFTKADGDTSGRKITVAQQPDVPIDASGDATHIAYDDGVVLLAVTTEILGAIELRIKDLPIKPTSPIVRILREGLCLRGAIAGATPDQILRQLAVAFVKRRCSNEWAIPNELPGYAKAFNVDAAKIRDEVAPAKAEAKPATKRPVKKRAKAR